MATLSMPTMPMESRGQNSDGGERSFNCYTAPGAVFHTEEEMKEHYRSEWHRHNLKRKVAGLAPLTREAFEERAAREATVAPGAASDTSWSRLSASTSFRSTSIASAGERCSHVATSAWTEYVFADRMGTIV